MLQEALLLTRSSDGRVGQFDLLSGERGAVPLRSFDASDDRTRERNLQVSKRRLPRRSEKRLRIGMEG